MRTFYLMQGGALEDYLSESSSQGRGSYGSGPPEEGCEAICNNPGQGVGLQRLKEECGCGETSASVDGGIGIAIVLGITLGVMTLLRLKNLKKG